MSNRGFVKDDIGLFGDYRTKCTKVKPNLDHTNRYFADNKRVYD